MSVEWEVVESGPKMADRTVLLLPGGLSRSRSYAELMAQPALAGVRLIAVTLPGHGGTPPPGDFGIENYARLAAGLVADFGCDAVLGFSFGASVALEMVASGAFCGPVVLLGASLSASDEPGFFRAIVGLGGLLGSLPSAAMLKMMALVVKQARLSDDRRGELLADFRKNDPRIMAEGLSAYLRYLRRAASPAARLCDAGVPAWVVHAEKGDGGLTRQERATLAACPHTTLVTIPGTSYFIPNEEPGLVASVLAEALGQVADRAHADRRGR
jgi:pimeloyl-ACP methyl ester carboxylesterase